MAFEGRDPLPLGFLSKYLMGTFEGGVTSSGQRKCPQGWHFIFAATGIYSSDADGSGPVAAWHCG